MGNVTESYILLIGVFFTFKIHSLSLVSNRTFTVKVMVNRLIVGYFSFLHGEVEMNLNMMF